MLKDKRVTIDGHEYNLRQLGALEGRRLWLQLLHVLVPPLKEAAAAKELDERTLASVLAAAIEGLDDKTAEALYEAFGRNCEVRDGEKWPQLSGVVFDLHFAGRYISMSKWLWECVNFNFTDFLGDMSLGKMTAFVRGAASKRESPLPSTGSSGAS